MIRVIVETPFAGNVEKNFRYLRACLHDCLRRGEAPLASHAIYTQPGVLDDSVPEERRLGMEAGFAWREVAHKTVVYTDLGISKGMQLGIDHARAIGHEVVFRVLNISPRQRICSVCNEFQFETPSGLVCLNGHGDAPSK